MKILYDHQVFEMQKVGGISRYFAELIAYYQKSAAVQVALPPLYSDNEYLKQLPVVNDRVQPKTETVDPYQKFLFGANFRGKGLVYRATKKVFPKPLVDIDAQRNKATSIAAIREGNFDIFHPTYYDAYFLDHIGNKPFVLTVYDLIHQIFPEFGMYETKDKSKTLFQRASKIIAISESTKADLVTIFNVPEEKIAVTYLANSLQASAATVSEAFKQKLPERYLLFVGNRDAYKNFLFFAQVAASIMETEPDLHIVCTGSPFNAGEQYFFKKIGITNRVYNTYVNDTELRYLYTKAAAFIFPSMYEGFGLPVLEAFSCGCPVLASRSSSLTEIGKEAVIYFEPKNPASMRKAITDVLYNVPLRQQKVAAGYEELKKFSWQQTAEETQKIYAAVLQAALTP